VAAAFVHSLADFTGVAASQLRDASLVTGLLIAAASAAGLAASGAPLVRSLPHDGVTGIFLIDASHIAVHTYPERGVLLLDVLAPADHDGRRAIDVFTRRLGAGAVQIQQHARL